MKLGHWLLALALVIFSLFINVKLTPFFGTADMQAFVRSGAVSNHFGLIEGYSVYNLYYPPITPSIIGIINNISGMSYDESMRDEYPSVESIGKDHLPIKTSLVIFSYVSFLLVGLYLYSTHKFSIISATITTIILSLNPAFIEITQILGYVDIYFVPPLLITLYMFIKKKYITAGAFFAITFLTKLIPILLFPVFVAYFIAYSKSKRVITIDRISLASFVFGVAIVSFPILLVFNLREVIQIAIVSANHGIYLSLNALNLPWIYRTLFATSNIATPTVALLFKLGFLISSCTVIVKLILSKKSYYNLLSCLILVSYGYFIFFTGAHENHLFTTVVLALSQVIYHNSPYSRSIFIGTSLLLFSNLFLFYQFGIGQIRPLVLSSSTINYISLFISGLTVTQYIVFMVKYLTDQTLKYD